MANVKTRTRISRIDQAMIDRANGFAAVGLAPANSILPANEDIEVQRNTQTTKEGARRMDAFDSLRAEARRNEGLTRKDGKKRPGMKADDLTAARRLEADMRTRMGEDDRGGMLVVVDTSGPSRDRVDRVIAAAKRIEAVFAILPPRDAWLLAELIYPTVTRPHWRDTVAHVTGETNEMTQGAAVRWACSNLVDAYERIDAGLKPQTLAMVRRAHATI